MQRMTCDDAIAAIDASSLQMTSINRYTGYSVARGERGYRGCNNQLNTKVAKHATEMVFGDAVAEECVPLSLFKLDLSMIDTISVATLAYVSYPKPPMPFYSPRVRLHASNFQAVGVPLCR